MELGRFGGLTEWTDDRMQLGLEYCTRICYPKGLTSNNIVYSSVKKKSLGLIPGANYPVVFQSLCHCPCLGGNLFLGPDSVQWFPVRDIERQAVFLVLSCQKLPSER